MLASMHYKLLAGVLAILAGWYAAETLHRYQDVRLAQAIERAHPETVTSGCDGDQRYTCSPEDLDDWHQSRTYALMEAVLRR